MDSQHAWVAGTSEHRPFMPMLAGNAGGLISKLNRRRSDVRILANQLLSRIPEMRPWLLNVDVFAGQEARASNATSVKQALKHLSVGGLLLVFPAGVVSHWRLDSGRVEDPPWHRLVARLARRSGAATVPLRFLGQNRARFHVAGLVHAGLRTALLPRELLARQQRPVSVRIGRPISSRIHRQVADDSLLTTWMRIRTEALGREKRSLRLPSQRTPLPIVPKGNEGALRREWEALPEACILARADRYRVMLAGADHIPRTLEEIGRLRELTFREVGEGSGREIDLDRFDNHYDHLFIASESEGAIVGAYRVGACDRILDRFGAAGLYTQSLFTLHRPLLRRLHTALELGRSFVSPAYQRQALPLALLWRGIGELLLREPKYDTLVGPASFSAASGPVVHRLAAALLVRRFGDASLSPAISPRRPLRLPLTPTERRFVREFNGDLNTMARLLRDLDSSGNGLPVLVHRYLELGGKVLAFNVDPSFGHCLDAFVMVDVPSAPAAILNRFMTREGALEYRAVHAGAVSA